MIVSTLEYVESVIDTCQMFSQLRLAGILGYHSSNMFYLIFYNRSPGDYHSLNAVLLGKHLWTVFYHRMILGKIPLSAQNFYHILYPHQLLLHVVTLADPLCHPVLFCISQR
jgi:hypothetical protein